ncbi:potassium transporter Kup [Planctomicrobium piriforme]|uniref:Probable potassium transport system protein Kup n=1 Tax=Planctomicrobium piriforme TaxID=1576369 RepID=A0A1I3GQM3_9PLAN|nr:potassium transporter Kup [Planctomicrobium piriforme]SFI25659.1 KUP system potassium uptake protein [Planctomicrobium piriforme]
MNAPKTPASRFANLWPLCLGSLGIVYGDIGTSPLYALRECFADHSGLVASEHNILGVLSLITWSLIVVISIKYLLVVMRADNDGEGGILALMALVGLHEAPKSRIRGVVILAGLFGAALLYGDGVITPAISVLSAVEGLDVATPFFRPYVVPITIVILTGLFWVQHRGTEKVGFVFGPVMIVWFSVLTILGLVQIVQEPDVLRAVNPYYLVQFFEHNGIKGFLILGVVFLVVTGGEALYADMGHFGKTPIRLTWFTVVLPALLTNYFGQGALLLRNPDAIAHPFYHLVSGWLLYPLVLLSTVATIVASQAVISGAFSLTMQAIQSGLMPRMEIRHTSDEEFGQVYVPLVNWLMMIGTIGLVVLFKSSSALASAYGIAITTTMVITTLLLFLAMRELWHWSLPAALFVCGIFLPIDLAFFGANLIKVLDGGWLPLLIATAIVIVMTTWDRGRDLLVERIQRIGMSDDDFFAKLDEHRPQRVPGTAIYLWSRPGDVPLALVQNIRMNHVVHEMIIILHINFSRRPRVPASERIKVERLRDDFYRVTMHFGFVQNPNVPRALRLTNQLPVKCGDKNTIYVIGRETVLSVPNIGMAPWRERLFVFMSRNALRANAFFSLPSDQVLEIGTQIEI